jgi:hypothetical protein
MEFNLRPWHILIWLLSVAATTWMDFYGIKLGLVPAVLRVFVIVPMCTYSAIWAVTTFDEGTHEDWQKIIVDDHRSLGTKLAVGGVLAALIISVFWAAVQG